MSTQLSIKEQTQDSNILSIGDRLLRNQDTQNAVNSLLRISHDNTSMEDVLRDALDLVVSIPWLSLQAKGGIFLVESEPKILVMKAQSGLASPLLEKCARVPFGRCLCGRAALNREIQFANCLDDRHETRYEGIQSHGHYCVPVLHANETLGVINLYVEEDHQHSQQEEEFLTAIADTLASIIVRKRAEEELRQSLQTMHLIFDGTVSALSAVSEQRDPYTAGHQQRVAQMACAIAKEIGLPEDKVEVIRIAAVLHDIGKISVPAEILARPGKLSNAEMTIIKCHSQSGYEILKTIPFGTPVADIVLQHHERLDGSGYPSGLCGENILLEARILSVADVAEAMVSHRPYRPALGIYQAIEELTRNKGIYYDPNVVNACLTILNEKIVASLESSQL